MGILASTFASVKRVLLAAVLLLATSSTLATMPEVAQAAEIYPITITLPSIGGEKITGSYGPKLGTDRFVAGVNANINSEVQTLLDTSDSDTTESVATEIGTIYVGTIKALQTSATAYDPATFTRCSLAITGGKYGVDYYATSAGELLIVGNGAYSLARPTGAAQSDMSVIIEGNATVTLNSVNIIDSPKSAIHVRGNSNATLLMNKTNQMTTKSTHHAAIQVDAGSTLTIDSAPNENPNNPNQLTAQTNGCGAGLGSAGDDGINNAVAGGDIIINGGILYANAGYNVKPSCAAGIGSGKGSSIGNITINGGKVTAVASVKLASYAAGLGAGQDGSCGNITITGGTVLAYSTQAYSDTAKGADAIGAGQNGTCGTITITGGSVRAQSTSDSDAACMTKTPTNGTSNLALVDVSFSGANGGDQIGSASFTSVDKLVYNVHDMKVSPSASAYFWLPVDTYYAETVVGGVSRTGLVSVLSDNTATATLSNSQVAVKLARDGQAWRDHGKKIALRAQASSSKVIEGTLLSNGATVFDSLPAGRYDIYDDDVNTGRQLYAGKTAVIEEVSYYSVKLSATAAGEATGASIAARSDDWSIASGDSVIAGHELVVSGVGEGSDTYTYVWEGAGVAGKTDETIVIEKVNAPVDVSCTIMGKKNAPDDKKNAPDDPSNTDSKTDNPKKDKGKPTLAKAGDSSIPVVALLATFIVAATTLISARKKARN